MKSGCTAQDGVGLVPKGLLTFLVLFFLYNTGFSPCLTLKGIYPGTYSLGLFVGLFSDAMGYCLLIVSCELTRTKWLVLKDHIWSTYDIVQPLWGSSTGVINFPWILFLSNAEFSPCWALPEYIRPLIHLACLRVFSVTPWVIVYRLYRVRWQWQSDWF